ALGVAFGRAHSRLREVAAPAPLRAAPEDWIAWAGPDEPALAERLRAVRRRDDRLLHLDYHPLNVMVDGGRVTGVLDWANALAGDPRADLARHVTILPLVTPIDPGQPRYTHFAPATQFHAV